MMDNAALLTLVTGLAELAGTEILAIRDRGYRTQHKADRSVVTEADHAAEAIIVAGLRAALPGCTVVAEEEVASGKVTAATREFWLVDPLDGTREFTGGGDDFAVNIGLVRDGRPVLGVVGVPAAGEIIGGSN
jgi:3'(2'), 5'-bisphosphate nucleotidase